MFNTWNMCWIKLAWWCAYQNLQMVSFLFRTSMSFISWSGLCSIFFLYFNKVYWRKADANLQPTIRWKYYIILSPIFFFQHCKSRPTIRSRYVLSLYRCHVLWRSYINLQGIIDTGHFILHAEFDKAKKKRKREEHTSRRKWQFGMNVDLVHFEHFCICKYTKDIANV